MAKPQFDRSPDDVLDGVSVEDLLAEQRAAEADGSDLPDTWLDPSVPEDAAKLIAMKFKAEDLENLAKRVVQLSMEKGPVTLQESRVSASGMMLALRLGLGLKAFPVVENNSEQPEPAQKTPVQVDTQPEAWLPTTDESGFDHPDQAAHEDAHVQEWEPASDPIPSEGEQ